MDAKQIQELAANTLLGRGVRYDMPAPFFLRIFRVKTIPLTLKNLKYGISLHISRLYLKTGIDPEETSKLTRHKVLELQANHGIEFSKIVAYAVLNSMFFTWLVKPLAWLLRAFAEEDNLAMMLYLILTLSAKKDFVDIIELAAGMVVTAAPKESQANEGS